MEKAGQVFQAVLHPGDNSSRRSLVNVLDELCLYGKDVFTDSLRTNCSLKSARLAFPALRDAVDGSIRRLELSVNADDKQHLEAGGQRFPLRRWPRLSHLVLFFGVADSQAAIHLALPFSGQTSESLERITDLSLEAQDDFLTTEGVVALSSLLPRFSRLRCLDLTATLAEDPLQQAFLRDALSSLTHLEKLTLRDLFIEPQSDDMIRRLKEVHFFTPDGEALGWINLSAARLCALETVSLLFHGLDDEDGGLLLQLLRRPPPGLRSLHINITSPMQDSCVTWHLKLVSGIVTEACQKYFAPLGRIAEFGSTVLLHLGRPLDLLHLSKVDVDRDDLELGVEQSLQQLRVLVQSSRRVKVDKVTIYPGCDDVDLALRVLKVLGVLPGVVSIRKENSDKMAAFQLETNKAGTAWQATPNAAAPMVAPDWSVMGGTELVVMALEMLLQRWEPAAEALAGSSSAAGSSAPTAGATASHAKPSANRSDIKHSQRIVRLQSPLFSMLAWAPAGLLGWMSHLEKQATEALASSDRDYRVFTRYLPIPPADTVLVGCISEEAAVAVEAAARTAGRFGSEGVIQVYPSSTCSLDDMLVEVAQAFWNSGEGGSEWQRLRLLLELGFALMDASPVVSLGENALPSD